MFEYIYEQYIDSDQIENKNSNSKQFDDKIEPIAKIVDLGNACWTNLHFTDEITTREYRAPEIILGKRFDSGVDIWSHGCLIFELLTGDKLFRPRKSRRNRYTKNEDHLARISELCGKFNHQYIQSGRNSVLYFDKDGHFRNINKLVYWPIDQVLIEKYYMPSNQAQLCADFLNKMLQVDPNKRASAKQLLKHSWLTITDADRLACYQAEQRWIAAGGEPNTDTNAEYDENGKVIKPQLKRSNYSNNTQLN